MKQFLLLLKGFFKNSLNMGNWIERKTVKGDTSVTQYIKINTNKRRIRTCLAMYFFKDKDTGHFVTYIPSFDLSGYGDTREEAKEMIDFQLDELYEHLIKLSIGKIDVELAKMGWRKNKMHNKEYSPASIDMDGVLKNFNPVENSIEVSSVTC